MRLTTSLLGLFLLSLPAIDALSLSDIQPINGFSDQCTAAYNTPLSGCQQSDFSNGGSCSTTCIAFLEALTKILNSECKGTSALPNTLIGLFFSNQATSTLCPNVLGSSGGSESNGGSQVTNSGQQQTSSNAVQTAIETSTVPFSTTTVSSLTTPSTTIHTPGSVLPASATSSSSTMSAAGDSTSTPISSAAATSNNAFNYPSSYSTMSSSTKSASKSQPSQQSSGGGGTILDIGNNSSGTRLRVTPWLGLGGVALLAWLF